MTRSGIHVDVLRNSRRGDYDCTNGGISSKFDSFTIIDSSMDFAPFEPDEEYPELKLVKSNGYIHAEPLEPVKEGNVGYMFGGNFIYSSDSRFPNKYPIPIHDRQDTYEQYERLST